MGEAQSHQHDALGTRTSKTANGATTSYAYSAQNRLASTSGAEAGSFAHDSNGNLTSDATGQYTYTPTNMLETATLPGVVYTYRYDGDNQRAIKMRGSGASITYYVRLDLAG